MSPLRLHRTEIVWAGLLLIIVLAAVTGISVGRKPGDGTWSTGPAGKRAFFALVESLLGKAGRSAQRLEPPVGTGTLLVLGPARQPDATEWRRLHNWVVSGHALIFAVAEDDPAVELTPFGLRVRATDPPGSAAREAEAPLKLDAALGAGDGLRWRGRGWLEGVRADAWVAASVRGRPVVVVQREGRGVIVVAASDELFQNASLLNPAVAVAAFRLLERARKSGSVVFDESLNGSGGPQVVGLLLGSALRPLTLQLLAVTVLFGWMGALRFGPPFSADPPSRRLMTEHARALGHLCYKAGAGSTLVASYLEYVRRELGLGPRGPARRTFVGGARRGGAIVLRAIGPAQELVDAGRIPNRQAAEAITELARQRAAVGRSTGKAASWS